MYDWWLAEREMKLHTEQARAQAEQRRLARLAQGARGVDRQPLLASALRGMRAIVSRLRLPRPVRAASADTPHETGEEHSRRKGEGQMKGMLTMGLLVLVVGALLLATHQTDVWAQGTRLGGFSGDDIYDPAAGGWPELYLLLTIGPSRASSNGSYSGDDAYDPAAGATPGLSVSAAMPSGRSLVSGGITYSGDDAYDPAARTAEGAAVARCGLPAAEILGRVALRMPGGLSGDDAYDPAAGGTPELSLLALGPEQGQLASCLPAGH